MKIFSKLETFWNLRKISLVYFTKCVLAFRCTFFLDKHANYANYMHKNEGLRFANWVGLFKCFLYLKTFFSVIVKIMQIFSFSKTPATDFHELQIATDSLNAQRAESYRPSRSQSWSSSSQHNNMSYQQEPAVSMLLLLPCRVLRFGCLLLTCYPCHMWAGHCYQIIVMHT